MNEASSAGAAASETSHSRTVLSPPEVASTGEWWAYPADGEAPIPVVSRCATDGRSGSVVSRMTVSGPRVGTTSCRESEENSATTHGSGSGTVTRSAGRPGSVTSTRPRSGLVSLHTARVRPSGLSGLATTTPEVTGRLAADRVAGPNGAVNTWTPPSARPAYTTRPSGDIATEPENRVPSSGMTRPVSRGTGPVVSTTVWCISAAVTPRTPVVRSREEAVWKIELVSDAAPRRPSGQSRTRPSTEYVTR